MQLLAGWRWPPRLADRYATVGWVEVQKRDGRGVWWPANKGDVLGDPCYLDLETSRLPRTDVLWIQDDLVVLCDETGLGAEREP